MKGLVLSGMSKREEAHALAKLALRSNVASTVAWHVYGLLHRADRNYEEAIKCYKNALRLDPTGQPQVLRDLAQLQIQTRDLSGFVDSRASILATQAEGQHNWTALAVGYHLAGAPALAVAVLDQWAPVAAAGAAKPPAGHTPTASDARAAQAAAYEASECALYAAAIQAEAGEHEAALARLEGLLAGAKGGAGGEAAAAAALKDARGARAARAGCLASLGRAADAEAAWRELLDDRPADLSTHDGLRAARGLPACGVATRAAVGPPGAPGGAGEGARGALRTLYAGLTAAHPSTPALRRCVLDFEAAGPAFTAAADAYARFHLTRGAPSLFADLAPLYPGGPVSSSAAAPGGGDPAKAVDLGVLFESYEAGLRGEGASLPPAPANAVAVGGPAAAPLPPPSHPAPVPTQLAGVCCLLGQHYTRLGRTGEALAAFDRADAALMGLKDGGGGGDGAARADILSARATTLAAAGDAPSAAAVAVSAAALDPSDRYLNSLASQALFASGDARAGAAMAARFARDAEASGAGGLSEMQCMWFEACAGTAALASGRHGPALKAFTSTIKHFTDFDEDAFDFHGYCARKCTLRAYVSLLRVGPSLRDDASFGDAAAGAVRVYLALDDARRSNSAAASAAAAAAAATEADAGASAEERKRARQRAKKEAARAEKAAAEKAAAAAAAATAERAAAAKEAASAATAPPKRAGSAAARAKKDADPDGAALAATPDPLAEAAALVALLASHAPARPDTHALCFEVAARRGKPLMMLRAARAAAGALGAGHWCARALALRAVVEVPKAIAAPSPAAHPALQAVLESGLAELKGGAATAQAMADGAADAAKAARDARALVAASTSSVDVLGCAGPTAAAALVGALPDPDPAGDAAGAHAGAVEVEGLLKRWEGGGDGGGPATAAWRNRCAAVFQWSAHFGGAKRVEVKKATGGVETVVNGVAGLAVA